MIGGFKNYSHCVQRIEETGVEIHEKSTKDRNDTRAVYSITFRLFGFCGATMTLSVYSAGASLAYRFENGINEDGEEMQMYGWIIRQDRPYQKVLDIVLQLIELSKTEDIK